MTQNDQDQTLVIERNLEGQARFVLGHTNEHAVHTKQ